MDIARTCEDYVVTRLVNLEEDYDKLEFDYEVAMLDIKARESQLSEARQMLADLCDLIVVSCEGEQAENFKLKDCYRSWEKERYDFVANCKAMAAKWSEQAEPASEAEDGEPDDIRR